MRPLVAVLLVVSAALLVATTGTPETARIARGLDADTVAERDAAARELAELGEEARATLESLVRDGTPEARRRARALLANLDDGSAATIRRLEARELIRVALRSEGRIAEGSAVDDRLAELGDAGAAEVAAGARRRLSRDALDGDAVASLARHASRETVATLAEALVRERVLVSDVVRAARVLEDAPDDLLDAAARDALDTVLCAHGDPRRRAAAALLLAFEPDRARDLADDADARVRLEAAQALRRTGLSGAGALERLAADGDPAVREAALVSLAFVPGAPRPAPAVRAAGDARASVRAAGAALLARDAVPESLPVLARLATDGSARVRAAAERSLAVLDRRRGR